MVKDGGYREVYSLVRTLGGSAGLTTVIACFISKKTSCFCTS